MVDKSKELYPSHLYISKDVTENFSSAETCNLNTTFFLLRF